MSNDKEVKELFNELNSKNKELSLLRAQLNEFNASKIKWMEESKKQSKLISQIGGEIKSSISKRDALKDKIKDLKEQRNKFNDEIKKMIESSREVMAKKNEILKKNNIRLDPVAIKQEMDFLEQKIETEAISFDKEKKMMKRINELKKQYKDIEKLGPVFSESHSVNRQINELKAKADEVHREIQKIAAESQKFHEVMISKSKEIVEVKKTQEDAFNKYKEYAEKFKEVNDKLKAKLGGLNKIREDIDEAKATSRDEKDKITKKKLDTLEKEVEEKIKSGKKLTTQDLLVLQAQDSQK